MTRVYMIRHGETDWNKAHRLQGWSDIPLNERGRAQAACAAKMMASVPLDVIYTSPLKRAVETADIIRGERDIPFLQKRVSLKSIWENGTAIRRRKWMRSIPGSMTSGGARRGMCILTAGRPLPKCRSGHGRPSFPWWIKKKESISCWCPTWAASVPSFSKLPAIH